MVRLELKQSAEHYGWPTSDESKSNAADPAAVSAGSLAHTDSCELDRRRYALCDSRNRRIPRAVSRIEKIKRKVPGVVKAGTAVPPVGRDSESLGSDPARTSKPSLNPS